MRATPASVATRLTALVRALTARRGRRLRRTSISMGQPLGGGVRPRGSGLVRGAAGRPVDLGSRRPGEGSLGTGPLDGVGGVDPQRRGHPVGASDAGVEVVVV